MRTWVRGCYTGFAGQDLLVFLEMLIIFLICTLICSIDGWIAHLYNKIHHIRPYKVKSEDYHRQSIKFTQICSEGSEYNVHSSKHESQIDDFRRKNRPSTVPLTINLINKCLKGKGGRGGLELMEYVAKEVEGGVDKERKRADEDEADGERLRLTGREECGIVGRVTQVVFRWEELGGLLEDMVDVCYIQLLSMRVHFLTPLFAFGAVSKMMRRYRSAASQMNSRC